MEDVPTEFEHISAADEMKKTREENARLRMENGILKKGRGVFCQGVPIRYAWIAKQEGLYPIILLCRVLFVSRSGYYDWQKQLPSDQQKWREKIRQAASASYQESDGVYGYRKVHEDVIEAVGFYCCPETVRRVLAAEGMKSQTVRKHRYPKTPLDEHYAPNLLSREFTANAPNEKWVSDII